MKLRILSAIAFLFNFALGQVAPPRDFDQYVESVRKAFDVPGLCVAIVKDGKVVLAKGYGLRTLGTSDKVDSKTNFGIASNTKAFTATALGLLVEEGKLKWDARVIDYLPWFQLSDPYVTRELTIRDLLVHRSGLGLGAGDLLWWPSSNYNRKEIAKRLRYIPLATSFRSAYAYDNVLYLIAGEVIETVSGMTWEDFVQKRILEKVGMTLTNVRHSDATRKGNVATPHAEINNVVKPIAAFDSDNTNPAGGINSNADDMSKWMICQLDSGKLSDGSRLFSPATTRQLWSIVTPTPIGMAPPELSGLQANFSGYALGFGIRDYLGRKIVSHTGGLPGYVSKVALVPSARLGVTVLTNQESGDAFESIVYKVLDDYLGGETHDWVYSYKRFRARIDSVITASEKTTATSRDSLSKPSLPLQKYAGTYTDQWYGDVAIEHNNGNLTIRFVPTPSLTGKLEHYQYNTFIARWNDPELRADAFITFSLNPDGTIDQAKMKAVSPATDFSFDFHDLTLKPAGKRN